MERLRRDSEETQNRLKTDSGKIIVVFQKSSGRSEEDSIKTQGRVDLGIDFQSDQLRKT